MSACPTIWKVETSRMTAGTPPFTNLQLRRKPIPARMTDSERQRPKTFRVLFPWIYRIITGMLLFQCLWGSIGGLKSLSLPPALAEQPMALKIPKNQHDHDQHGHHHVPAPQPGQWEGSPEAIAYSEFNHALAGAGVIVVGLSEFRAAMGWQALAWARWLLPGSLLGAGIFLLIWSDHDAWPIGSWTLAETISGKDPEMLQHKVFGILALGVGTVEWLLRRGTLSHLFWRMLLPGFALVGGLMLYAHMHGPHPAGDQIQLHHTVMGTLALAGGLAWFGGELMREPHKSRPTIMHPRFALKVLWSLLIIAIGVQLLFYSET
jgi:hypothetical protein